MREMEESKINIGEIRQIAQDVFEECGATVVDVKIGTTKEGYFVVVKGSVFLSALNVFAERVGDKDILLRTTDVYDEIRLFFIPRCCA